MAVKPTTVEVVMPAMGDSVAEGTILEWHKSEGDTVAADETIVEISTEKVDAEVPAQIAPGTGTGVPAGAGANGATMGGNGTVAEPEPATETEAEQIVEIV